MLGDFWASRGGREQPTEIWLAARIRFFLKPRVRIWNQAGLIELVTITAPKHVIHNYTNGLSQNEVSNRLTGLADLLDSRGWAVKNVAANEYSNPIQMQNINQNEDRLLGLSSLPQEVSEVMPAEDVLDEKSSPTAQNFDALIKTSEQKHRQELIDNLNQLRNPVSLAPPTEVFEDKSADFWHMQSNKPAHETSVKESHKVSAKKPQADPQLPEEPALTTFQSAQVVAPHLAPVATIGSAVVIGEDEQAILNKIHKIHDQSSHQYGHLKTLQPISDQAVIDPVVMAPAVPILPPPPVPIVPAIAVTPPVDADILKLAGNDDLNVATLARQAEKSAKKHKADGEVTISLR